VFRLFCSGLAPLHRLATGGIELSAQAAQGAIAAASGAILTAIKNDLQVQLVPGLLREQPLEITHRHPLGRRIASLRELPGCFCCINDWWRGPRTSLQRLLAKGQVSQELELELRELPARKRSTSAAGAPSAWKDNVALFAYAADSTSLAD
jgi:hypothetical protein